MTMFFCIISLVLPTKLEFIPVFLSIACATTVHHTVVASVALSSPSGLKKH